MLNYRPVAILYAGGRYLKFNNQRHYSRWFKAFVEMNMVSSATPVLITGEPFPQGYTHILRALRRIHREWSKYHGFVIMLQRDNFLHTAILMNYMLGNALGKPIVFTTASPEDAIKESGKYNDMGLKANVVNAALAASVNVAGAMVVVGPELVPTAHALTIEVPEHERGAGGSRERVTSIDNKTCGRLDFGLQKASLVKELYNRRPDLALEHEENVHWISLNKKNASADDAALTNTLAAELKKAASAKALIIQSADPLPPAIMSQLPKNCPAIITAADGIYLFNRGKVTLVENMIPAAATAKLVWLLGQSKHPAFKKKFGSDLAKLMKREFIDEFVKIPS